MIVVGGIGSVRGAIAGAIIFGLISELLRQVLSFQEIIYGAILIVFMMFLPKGLFSGRESKRSIIAREATEKSGVGTEAKGSKA